MDQAIYERVVKHVVEQLKVKPETITPSTSFQGDLNADSLDIVELAMKLEEEFGIDIPDEDVDKIQTVGDAVNYISARIG